MDSILKNIQNRIFSWNQFIRIFIQYQKRSTSHPKVPQSARLSVGRAIASWAMPKYWWLNLEGASFIPQNH